MGPEKKVNLGSVIEIERFSLQSVSIYFFSVSVVQNYCATLL